VGCDLGQEPVDLLRLDGDDHKPRAPHRLQVVAQDGEAALGERRQEIALPPREQDLGRGHAAPLDDPVRDRGAYVTGAQDGYRLGA